MQPTIQSQARLRRLVWLVSALLVLVVVAGGLQWGRHAAEMARLEDEAQRAVDALAAAQREASDARQAAAGLRFSLRGAEDRVQAAEGARAKAEAIARSADTMCVELEGKLRTAEAARAEAEAKLRAATEKSDAQLEGRPN